MSAKYKSPSFLLPNELNTSANTANDTGINSLYSMDFGGAGSSQKIDVGILPMNGDAEYSISIWFYYFKPGGSVPAMQMFGNRDTSNSYKGVGFEFGNAVAGGGVPVSYFYFNSTAGSGAASITIPAGTFNANAWNHLCITKDLTTVNAYVNNQSPISVSSTKVFSSTASFKIGTDVNLYYNNKIDEVAIFNRALDSTEISSLWNNGSPSNLMASNLNPLAYYPLGEQAQMQGYLGNEASSEWQFPNGVLQDYVMDFDGADDIDTKLTIDSTYSALTISAWVNFNNLTSFSAVLGQWRNNSFPNSTVLLYLDNTSKIQVLFSSGSNYVRAGLNTTLQTNRWYNLIVLWDGSTVKLYIDGSVQSTTGSLSSLNNSDVTLKIGCYNNQTGNGTTNNIDGQISNVAIWNTDQSTNIANIYNNGSPQTSYTVTPQNWWKLNATSVYTPSAPNYTTALDFGGSQSVDTNYTGLDGLSKATISLWVKPDVASANGTIFNARDGSAVGMNCQFFTSKTYLYFTGSINVISANYTPPFSDNLWANLVIVFDGTLTGNDRIKLYANGETKVIDTYNGTIPAVLPTSSTSLKIAESFNGQVSNFAIFNSALTSSQVSTLFNFGTPETNISFSPQAWWKLDNTTTGIQDSSGNGNNGTNNGATDISSGVAVTPSWKIPNALTIPTINYTTALDFPGSSDYIDYGNPSNLNIDENITVSAWFKNNGTTGQQIISKGVYTGETGSGFPYEIQVRSNGGIAWQYYGTNTQGSTSGRRVYILSPTTGASAVDYRDNTWHHVVGTKNGVNSKLYIDGVLITDVSGGGSERDYMVTNTSPVRIGANSSGTGEFTGEISNVAIWDSALTDGGVSVGSVAGGQIAGLYNSGQPQTSMSYSPLSWWKLDNVTTGIQDSGSASNNGTIVGQVTKATSDVTSPGFNIPVNGVSTTLPSTALQQSDLQFDSPYSNYSLSFDGTGDNINVGNIQSLQGSSNFSISAWINLSASFSNRIFGSWDTSVSKRIVGFAVSSVNTLVLQVSNDGTNFEQRYSTSTISTNSWTHVVATFSNGNVNFYINGSIETPSSTTITQLYNVSSDYFIGALKSSETTPMNGNIDETSIFNTELTSAQVLEIYNNGRPKDLTTFSGTAPTNWWRLGENAYFNDVPAFIVPNSISGAPNGTGSGSITTMISADAPGTYANGIGTNLDILDRVGDAPLSTSNSQSYNMIPSDISPYVPQYVGDQIANNFSMTFDGVNDYFNAGNPTELQITGELSISLWFKTSTTPATSGYLISKGVSPYTSRNFAIWFSNNNTVRAAVNGVSGLVTSPASNYNDDNWHHCVFTFTPSTSTILYIDGSAVVTNTTSIPSAITNNTSNLEIGKNVSEYFTGEIDEVAIFDTALNAGQIYNDIYQPTATGTNQTADFVNNPNLPNPVAWYRMGD